MFAWVGNDREKRVRERDREQTGLHIGDLLAAISVECAFSRWPASVVSVTLANFMCSQTSYPAMLIRKGLIWLVVRWWCSVAIAVEPFSRNHRDCIRLCIFGYTFLLRPTTLINAPVIAQHKFQCQNLMEIVVMPVMVVRYLLMVEQYRTMMTNVKD